MVMGPLPLANMTTPTHIDLFHLVGSTTLAWSSSTRDFHLRNLCEFSGLRQPRLLPNRPSRDSINSSKFMDKFERMSIWDKICRLVCIKSHLWHVSTMARPRRFYKCLVLCQNVTLAIEALWSTHWCYPSWAYDEITLPGFSMIETHNTNQGLIHSGL